MCCGLILKAYNYLLLFYWNKDNISFLENLYAYVTNYCCSYVYFAVIIVLKKLSIRTGPCGIYEQKNNLNIKTYLYKNNIMICMDSKNKCFFYMLNEI